MKKIVFKTKLLLVSLIICASCITAQDTIMYTGNTLSNPDYHHGQLTPAIGVHNIQVFRANREYPDSAGGTDWTYHHGPNMAYWNGTFYVQFLSNPVGEHIAPGLVFLVKSNDGYNWSKPEILFPTYRIPDGTTKEEVEGVAKDLDAVLHQRMGFYVASNNILLTLGYYGICLFPRDSPNDGKGIGRVVREIMEDGSFGPIYFIRYNSGWDESNTQYPFYKSSKNKKFIQACDELLSKPLMMQQWVEEADRDDPLIPLKKQFKAFSYYHLVDGRVVGLWKYALTSISEDDGKSWLYKPMRAPGFVNKNAKIWGQKTSDGRYATVYNPSQFRWPLGISTSNDGLVYTNLLLVHGEITTMRYGGQHKSYGPQYVRGILEGNGTPPNGDMWVTYSMNKEDIWVSKIPVPVNAEEKNHINDVFNDLPDGEELNFWNVYSPLMAPVKIVKKEDGLKWLKLSDWDKFDYALAERKIPNSKTLEAEFIVAANQNDHGTLEIEFQNSKGNACARLIFDENGDCKIKDGYRFSRKLQYKPNEEYKINIKLNVKTNNYVLTIDGKKFNATQFFAPVESIERIVFRTGKRRHYPNSDSIGKQNFDVPDGGEFDKPASFFIKYLKTSKL